MGRVQQSLPIYLKLISDKAKLEELLGKLTTLNNGFFRALPTSESSLPRQAQGSPQKLSFDIPFLPNVRKYSDYVGREYLLEDLAPEVEKGKHVQNIIVLHGTGVMGKTELALEYIHQHYKGQGARLHSDNAAAD